MTTARELADAVVAVTTSETLESARESESISDVIGVHRSVLEARLGGRWSREVEQGAIELLKGGES